jgi:hypothetical protein
LQLNDPISTYTKIAYGMLLILHAAGAVSCQLPLQQQRLKLELVT